MRRLLLTRVLQSVLVAWLVSAGTFVLGQAAPGDPFSVELGDGALAMSAQEREALRAHYGLDLPWWQQYGRWVSSVVQGDLGESISFHRPVADLIAERMPASLLLMGSALSIALVLGVGFGVLGAVRSGSWMDRAIAWFTTLGISMPQVWVGLMLIHVFAVWLHWLPSGGMTRQFHPTAGGFSDRAAHLVLPALTLAFAQLAMWSRYQQASLQEVLDQDFVRTARAKGVGETRVVLRHAWRNALLPVATLFGTSLGALVEGSYIVETVFSWPGLGRLGVDAILRRDYPLVLGVALVVSGFILAGNFLADLSYGALDPRLRKLTARPGA